ncbi:hypothetical protein CLAIMM_01456 [Cladophialophora immunda]|nr:hypothetical protein CLAIMM_01456 [Cladophialophora immunda]
MPGDPPHYPGKHRRLSQLIQAGYSLAELESIEWSKGQGTRQTAFLCYSSGTSGLPKGVQISHYNVIANVIQIELIDRNFRNQIEPGYRDVTLGLMPQSHIYGLVAICLAAAYRGDCVVVLPKFEIQHYLSAISNFKINSLCVVPPIIINMVKNKSLCEKFDLRSVKQILTGAAPLGEEVAQALARQYPDWIVRQGYGLTETATVATSSIPGDIWLGSSGCLVPGYEAKLMSPEFVEIRNYNQPGELLLKSPSVALGYLNNMEATKETFVDMAEGRFLRTGDECEIRKSPNGTEHIWVLDRIKELIKVKGLQVAPAELEAWLLQHPEVADCAVIPVHDDRAGEVPKAFVVRSTTTSKEDDATVKSRIAKHVETGKARHKWLAGGIEFTNAIPKSPSGKILRRLLRDREREMRRKADFKI